ncbi:MAG: ribonuclease E/G [Lachnospiraceae bacterium]|nr:ribonuclease E/G [Lachnospiraceae bacterium]
MSERIIITKEELYEQEYLVCANYDYKRMTEIRLQKVEQESILGNIYIGRVTNIVESLHAAFIEIEKGLVCFYSLEDLRSPIFTKKLGTKPICVGDELVVEVKRENIKTKPPVVSTNLNFTGRYLVLTTENHKLGISKKLSATDRSRLQAFMTPYLSKEYGWIVRTNAVLAKEEEIFQELQDLQDSYSKLIETAKYRTCYSLLRKSTPSYFSFLNGMMLSNIEKITTDIPSIYEELQEYFQGTEIESQNELLFYEDPLVSLSAIYNLKQELDRALNRQVWLPSGGYLIIEATEALTVIDVNSGKDRKKRSREETILSINIEAAIEIARQLILRNISGICIIDFIDMKEKKHQEKLLHILRMELKKDKIPATLVDMTRLGLVELTRKKVQKSLKEQLQGEIPYEK